MIKCSLAIAVSACRPARASGGLIISTGAVARAVQGVGRRHGRIAHARHHAAVPRPAPVDAAWAKFIKRIVYVSLNATDVANFHRDLGDWLKENDPFDHLVTTSLTGSSDRPEIWNLTQMDFAMYHSYGLGEPARQLPPIVHSMLTKYQKPVMVGELGIDFRGFGADVDASGEAVFTKTGPVLLGRAGIYATALLRIERELDQYRGEKALRENIGQAVNEARARVNQLVADERPAGGVF